jgi:hypothetical protein
MINVNEKAEQLKVLEQNLNIYKESIREISLEILQNNVSKYPVFVAYADAVTIGKMIIDKEELALEYSINASTLEEFVAKNIVLSSKLNDFKKTWKDPKSFACIFAIIEKDAGFVYIPYSDDEE